MLLIFCISCTTLNINQVQKKNTGHSQEILFDMLAYIPEGLVDYHPADLYGMQINYFDFEVMRKDLKLPDIDGTASWEDKLKLIIGYQFEGLQGFPQDLDPANHDTYAAYGFDLADISQSLVLVDQDAAILRGTFDARNIDQALLTKNYAVSLGMKFAVYTGNEDQYCFGISEEVILIGQTCDDVETMIWQKDNPERSASQMVQIRQMVQKTHNPHGLTLLSSGDLPAFNLKMDEIVKMTPYLEDILMKDNNNYQLDWEYVLVTYHALSEQTDLDLFYIFPTEALAIEYLPIVEDALTNTPSFVNYHNLSWSELLTIKSMETQSQLIHVTATTNGKNFLGNRFLSNDFYGLIPLKQIE